ncbi:MAG: glutamate-5-semialdehyde dehydrogenase [Synechococcus sp. SB0668_bin_15]|nr:glutamate-5-semialdehyde dehydrogenase [Synechococcus sp. SB0668_bin_15]MYC50610.1 glutamate-5-semialdehyde dehydrogenase [Synechococcus sp. SB0662_bin_14]
MPVINPPADFLRHRAQRVRRSALALGRRSNGQRIAALEAMAAALERHGGAIVAANTVDQEAAVREGLAAPLLARLKLNGAKLAGCIQGLRQVATLPDPVGHRQLHRELAAGLELERVTVPVGVLGVVFESRPDAVIQIAALAVRSGNGAILKGGREALNTCQAIVTALQEGLAGSAVDPNSLDLLTSREETMALLRLDDLVDLIVPRGSNAFVRTIQDNTRIPVLGHADGVCHLYVDQLVNIDMAVAVALDAKTQYPAACNAIETLLVHRHVARRFLPPAVAAFTAAGVTLRGDEQARALGVPEAATPEDWGHEYLDLILAVRVVEDLEAALEHIRRHGSRHTDVICTDDEAAAARFLGTVDSAGVFHNCSSRFADGFRYGLGAEVGISTQTMPPRGPVGLEGLVTYRYRLRGHGHTVAPFACGEQRFSHRNLLEA